MSPRPHRHTTAPVASTTTTITATLSGTADPSSRIIIPSSGRLQLRGEATTSEQREPERRIRWAEDVVNNEGMGRKSSKVCCIYHKPRAVGESSSEDSSSSSDNDSDSDHDDGAARPARRRPHEHDHDHGDDPCNNEHKSSGHHGKQRNGKGNQTGKPSLNAYEKQPKVPAPTVKDVQNT